MILQRCHDAVWCFLHILILNIPPTRLVLFPALAGSVWFLTLASLLLTWIARGMPRYPGQSNPHVAFISDIASFELKPLFLVGSAIVAVGFVLTVAAVHVVRYEPGFALVQARTPAEDAEGSSSQVHPHEPDNPHDEDDNTTRTLKLISLLSIFAAGVASTALILLSVMDTFRYKIAHHIFLRICFAGLAVQSACTAIVYFNEVLGFVSFVHHLGRWQHDWGRRHLRVRVFAALSTALIIVELFLGVAFVSLTIPDENPNYSRAGVLEWVIAFLGTIYLWLFCGFLDRTDFTGYVPSALYKRAMPEAAPPDAERAPLLRRLSGRKYTS
ncbi:Frag1/DRAM/Sfk1 family-domain-containing protein [Aspergillus ambiguus]|uniref:Frag1/DRAM/Sfk1 family-domain-containing protein n=1 Tax=Aspergillus ambiguus TaxID=176160 RepID=UPI003CCD3F36